MSWLILGGGDALSYHCRLSYILREKRIVILGMEGVRVSSVVCFRGMARSNKCI